MSRKNKIASSVCFILAVLMIAIAIYAEVASGGEVAVYIVTALIGSAVLFTGHALNPGILLWNAHKNPVTQSQKYIFGLVPLIMLSGLLVHFFAR